MIKYTSDALFRKDEAGRNLMHCISHNGYYSDEQAEMLLKLEQLQRKFPKLVKRFGKQSI
jgi:hypothetical protein